MIYPESITRSPWPKRLPPALAGALRHRTARPGRWLITVSIRQQALRLWRQTGAPRESCGFWPWASYLVSTSRYGVGQKESSFQTPLGLHRVARKVGGGYPPGIVFRHRVPMGYTWQGLAGATIVHRILWLEGMEPGRNRGGNVDSFRRYIYIHGFGDETTLGRPQSHGCIHMAGADLLTLYDRVPLGTPVWIGRD